MHITLEADYAIRIVQVLAQNQRRLDAKTISEMTGVTLRFSLKILRKLVAAGIIKSFKGTQGGYDQISSVNGKRFFFCGDSIRFHLTERKHQY